MVKRAIEGITVNEDTIGFDVIKKVATSDIKGVNFLAEKHTRKHMKSELYMPRLANRARRTTWLKKGGKDIVQMAREKVDQILKDHQPNDLDNQMEEELKNYMKVVAERSFDDYRQAEGLMVDSVTLPDGIEIRDNK